MFARSQEYEKEMKLIKFLSGKIFNILSYV
jgi:hypothetical protein